MMGQSGTHPPALWVQSMKLVVIHEDPFLLKREEYLIYSWSGNYDRSTASLQAKLQVQIWKASKPAKNYNLI